MSIAIIDGQPIHYEIKGSGEPILFLHGMGASWKAWEPQWDSFSSNYKMIMVDLRGHGDSSKVFPDGKFTFEAMCADLPLLLDHLGIEKTHVVGFSMGGVIAQMFACHYPQYVKSLVLADTWCELPNQTSKWVLATTVFLAKILPISFINKSIYSLYKGEDEDQVYTRQILEKSLQFTKESFIAMKTTPLPNIKGELKNIHVPSLVMFGDRKSYGIDEEKGARTIYNEIPDAKLIGFQGAFDPVTVMRRHQFNKIVFHFLCGKELPVLEGVYYETK